MGRLVTAQNPSTSGLSATRLSSASSASATSLTVSNNSNFAIDNFIIVGGEGSETAELVRVSSLSGTTTINLASGLKFAHALNDAVRVVPSDKVRFYGAQSTTITVSDLLATADVEVDNPDRETSFYHSSGNNNWYYKFTYYNTTTGSESSLSDAVLISGGTSNDLYCSEEDIYSSLHISKDDETAPNSGMVLRLISSRTERMNAETNSSFRTETITISSYQYVDGRGKYRKWYFLGKAPVISVTGLDITDSIPGKTATWTALTEGRDDDFTLTKETGMVFLTSSTVYPLDYPDSLRWYGTWGRTSVPEDVRNAVISGVLIDLSKTTYAKAAIKGRTKDLGLNGLERLEEDWKRTVSRYRVLRYMNT